MPNLQKPRSFSRPLYLLVGALISLLLIGCANIETEVTIYADEQWEGATIIELPPETVGLLGGMNTLEQRLNETQREAEQDQLAMDLTWEQQSDGSVAITGEAQGSGFDNLNKTFFDGEANISFNQRQQIIIERSYPVQLVQAGSNTVRITGGEIIRSNADEVEGNTAIWRNPSRIEVTLTEASDSLLAMWGVIGGSIIGLCLCGGLILGVAGIGGFYWYRQRQDQ